MNDAELYRVLIDYACCVYHKPRGTIFSKTTLNYREGQRRGCYILCVPRSALEQSNEVLNRPLFKLFEAVLKLPRAALNNCV